MKVAIYNKESGVITKRLETTSPNNIILNCEVSEEFYLNCPCAATHIIKNEPIEIMAEPVVRPQ